MKRSVKIGIGVAVVVVGGIVTVAMIRGKDGDLQAVNTSKVERVDLVSKVTANGKVEAQRKVDLSANIMGQIVNLAVREGDTVKKGDFLLQIDKVQLAASALGAEESLKAIFHDRDAARAAAAEAAANFQRAQKSFADKLISQAELDRNRAAVDSARANVAAIEGRIGQARANLAGARDSLSKTTIRAPMAGVVTRLPVEEGEVAVIGTMNNPGTVLLTISDMSTVEAVMEVDETDIPAVKIGQKATITLDAYANKTFNGVVTEVASSPIAAAGSEAINFEVKIQMEDPPAEVRPGFSTSAEIVTGTRPQAVAVPIQALVMREQPAAKGKTAAAKPKEEEGVYAYDAKTEKIAFVPVTTGITGDTLIEIASGLEAGREIVTGPFKALREIKDGDRVKLEKEKAPGDKDKDGKGQEGG